MVFIFRLKVIAPKIEGEIPAEIYNILVRAWASGDFVAFYSASKDSNLSGLSDSESIKGWQAELLKAAGGSKTQLRAYLKEIFNDPKLKDKITIEGDLSDLVPDERSKDIMADSIKFISVRF